ncbi:cytochrome P450 [Amniculicola lignicola CBS 123094]|uniref:Cytochrome P450 n=1 Tax=Amniculicola lignicola CBS 123094 TaxID=1392246 RepID=A0A6A5WK18_9PLEO|nr:cytochrome P450 [Amniculicola lignicola CBS 123094]
MFASDWFPSPSWAVVLILVFTLVVRKLYIVLTHPLRKFPGPFLASISDIPTSYSALRGRKQLDAVALHEKYGPVVRVAPNELSFNTAQSWRDIYSFRPGHDTFTKSEFYSGGWFSDAGVYGVITVRDVREHAVQRRYLSHAFSASALREQEALIASTIDLLIERMREVGVERGETVDMLLWLRMCAFDVIGSLAFGNTFDALKNGGQHPSIRFLHEATKLFALSEILHRFRYTGKIVLLVFLRKLLRISRASKTHEGFVVDTVKHRLSNPSKRPDILTRMIENYEASLSGPIEIQIAAHAADLMIAGSDTSSTTIYTVLNYIVRSPALYDRIKIDVRSMFETYADINAVAASTIPFLRQLILEAMRIYPPIAMGLPRHAPKGGDTVDGHFVPEGTTVSTHALAASLSPTNFEDPYEFRPERWETKPSSEQKKKDILEASQPFSMGPRGCLGQNLAWVEMNIVICKIIWSFDLELVNKEMDLHRDSKIYSLWDSPPLLIRVKERAHTVPA